jgi:hypothetical protein
LFYIEIVLAANQRAIVPPMYIQIVFAEVESEKDVFSDVREATHRTVIEVYQLLDQKTSSQEHICLKSKTQNDLCLAQAAPCYTPRQIKCRYAMINLTESNVFRTVGSALSVNISGEVSEKTNDRRFRKNFGVGIPNCVKVWSLIAQDLPEGASQVHLLWALYFLKHYGIEEVNSAFAQCDKKTFRKWSWTMIKAVAALELVSQVGVCLC